MPGNNHQMSVSGDCHGREQELKPFEAWVAGKLMSTSLGCEAKRALEAPAPAAAAAAPAASEVTIFDGRHDGEFRW